MTEEQLEHLIRAACAVINESSVYVIGSQSILPWLRERAGKPPRAWPGVLTLSTEADIIPISNSDHQSDLIEGSLGQDSLFEKTYGYYAQGVSLKTAEAPSDWVSRCYNLVNQNTWNTVGRCMHPVDLFIAKSCANREKDGPFLDAMIECGLVKERNVKHLLPKLDGVISAEKITVVTQCIEARFRKIAAQVEDGSTGQSPMGAMIDRLHEILDCASEGEHPASQEAPEYKPQGGQTTSRSGTPPKRSAP